MTIPTIEIRSDPLDAARANILPDTPIFMLNLLRFRDQAHYADRNEPPCSGRDAYYTRYAPVATKLVLEIGGQVIWAGSALAHIVAPADERWDDVLLVRYPNFARIMELFEKPEYQAVVHHRTAALADSRLIATQAMEGLVPNP